jgi:hypothetical protein
MLCLRPLTWLNDEVINFYMCMLQERDDHLCRNDSNRRKVAIMYEAKFIYVCLKNFLSISLHVVTFLQLLFHGSTACHGQEVHVQKHWGGFKIQYLSSFLYFYISITDNFSGGQRTLMYSNWTRSISQLTYKIVIGLSP